MNNNDIKVIKESFARLFVIAIQNKINFLSFTKLLVKSVFIDKIEKGLYDDYFNKSLEDIFFDITKNRLKTDNSYGIYNDAYWAGSSYFEIYLRTNKPFSYIFLKLPLSKMMDIYPVFHEMDFSELLDLFTRLEKEKTIFRLLCEEKKCSLSAISGVTGINKATLSKYNESDKSLYQASFQNIVKIAKFFDAPFSLFEINIKNI